MNSKLQSLKDSLTSVISGKEDAIELLLVAVLADGHVLMEDVPGVGKTTLAKTLARSIDSEFQRIQFTPDLLPSDIIGSSVYNPKDGSFHFRRGPIFAHIVLADEINRASPRTQSALLESMNERQITAEGHTYELARPFLVIATENPVEYYGTYPLPEAQLDRFAMQITLGYPDFESESLLLRSRRSADPLDSVKKILNRDELVAFQDEVKNVEIEKTVSEYMLKIVRKTREDSRITLGASPRALLTLSRCAQARAFISDRKFSTPDDVGAVAEHVLSHRIVLDGKSKHSGVSKRQIISEIVSSIAPPI